MSSVSSIRRRRLSRFCIVLAMLVGTFVACASVDARGGELVVNGSFETGTFGAAWVNGAYRGATNNPTYADHVVAADLPYSGNYSALLGFKYVTQTTGAAGYMYQTVSIPTNISSARLYFKVRQQGYDSTPYDPFVAQIRATNNSVLQTVLELTFPEYNNLFKDSGWVSDNNTPPDGVNMMAYQGQTVRLYFEQANTIDALYETWTMVDDVSLIYKRFVDLAVDGNGDDVFGALGSGAGGLAVRGATAGDTLVYDLRVENEGIDSDTYRLSVNLPVGWNAWVDAGGGPQAFPYTAPSMAAGTVASYAVHVVVPAGAATGTYDVVLDAVSTTQSNRYDSATLRANVTAAAFGSDLVVDGNGFGVTGLGGAGGFALKEAPWDSTVTYSVELINTGDTPTDYRVSMAVDSPELATLWLSGTPHTSLFTTPAIPAGGSLVMTLDLRVPSPTLGGDYTTIVLATALSDTLKKDTIKASLRLRSPRVDMIIGASGDGIYDATSSGLGGSSTAAGNRGTAVIFPLVVQNESVLADSFQLSWVSPGAGWTAALVVGGVDRTFPFTTPTINAKASVSYSLKITVPAGEAFGTYRSFLNAVSLRAAGVSESVTAAVSVTDASQVDMVIDGFGDGIFGPIGTGLGGSSTRSLSPGDSVTFTVDLRNLTGTNSFNLSWNTPAGWRVTFNGQSSPITGITAGIYALKVVVPASAPGGTADIILDAKKTDKPFYMDSVIGRVVVIPPYIVDALIDGNGDGVYGALGTGLGGFSSGIHSAPAALNFTVELQNESAAADQYTVTWNTIPGWSATLGGSASPYLTTSIGAGGSRLLTFHVTAPSNEPAGEYDYIIDIRSDADPATVESVNARVTIVGPPRVDLIIDGNGHEAFGPYGSGDGGSSVRAAGPGVFYTAVLTVHNAGSFADSFQVDWTPPAGWPAGSVIISDGPTDLTSPFWTPIINPAAFRDYTVKVQVPAGAGLGKFDAIINAHSSLPPNAPESVRLTTQTFGVVTGVVFNDADQDGAFGAGDSSLAGVTVDENVSGGVGITGGDGRYAFWILDGQSGFVIEHNPSGFTSLSPDSIGPMAVAAGDTIEVDFADFRGLSLTPGTVMNGIPGAYVDFPHVLMSGVQGQVALTATPSDPSVVTMFLLDANANGVIDGADRALTAGDLAMDPSAGKTSVSLILRAFVPSAAAVGTMYRVTVDASQPVGATPLVTTAQAADAVVVVAGSVGRVTLHKDVDLPAAQPGDVITYTISFINAGADTLQNIILLDPISPHVDPLSDAFGPGQDVELVLPGSSVFLSFNPADADECEFSASERLLRVILSKNSPYFLRPGDSGSLVYKVTIR